MRSRLNKLTPCGVVVACAFSAVAPARATVYYVNGSAGNDASTGTSWSTAFLTVDRGLSVAGPGDQVWVAAGTYVPGLGLSSDTFSVPEGVQLLGGFGGDEASSNDANTTAHQTILSGDFGCDTVLTCTDSGPAAARTVVEGFTIRYGFQRGIAVIANFPNASEPRLDLLDVNNNGYYTYTSTMGGGLLVVGGSSPIITRSYIHENYGVMGAGMYIDSYSRATVTNVTFESNHAGSVDLGEGGAVYSEADTNGHSATVFRDCTFENNYAHGGDGGGVLTVGGVLRFLNCSFHYCTSTVKSDESRGNGGAIAAIPAYDGGPAPMVTLHNVSFAENGCYEPLGEPLATRWGGGGVFIVRGRLEITNGLFWLCTADSSNMIDTEAVGGAILADHPVSLTLTNVTASTNRAWLYGGLFVQDGSTSIVHITNSIFWNNGAVASSANVADAQLVEMEVVAGTNTVTNHISVNYCDIMDATAGDGNIPFGAAHNIDLDPQFTTVKFGDLNEDYHLAACSPAIDAADTTAIPYDVDDLNTNQVSACTNNAPGERQPDLDGRPRTLDGGSYHGGVTDSMCSVGLGLSADMGAYEFGRKGDINEDNRVDALDIQLFVDCLLGGASSTNGRDCLLGDFTGSGVVDAYQPVVKVSPLHCRASISLARAGGWIAVMQPADTAQASYQRPGV